MRTRGTTATTSENRPGDALPIPGADETHEESLQIMDKLKENAYWISLGAIVVVLLLLVWFLVVARIYGGSGDTVRTLGAKLERDLSSIEKFTRLDYVPTSAYEEHLQKALERVRLDHNDGAREYNDARERFSQFFDGTPEVPDAGLFASTYHEKIEELIKNYREEFGIEARVDDEEDKVQAEVPGVDRLDQAEIVADNVPIAMKEYWIAEAIFDALTKLKIGGLQTVRFPGRLGRKDAEEENEHFALIDVALMIEMPFSKIEDLISELFGDDRVLFVFDGLEITKSVQHLKPFMALKKVVEFENRDDADGAAYADVVDEPNVSVVLTLKVLHWKGLDEIERSDLGDDEEAYVEDGFDGGDFAEDEEL